MGVLQIGMELDRWLANHRPHLTYAPVHWYSTVVQHSDTVEWYRTVVQFTRDGGVLSQVPQPLFLVAFGQLGNLSGGYVGQFPQDGENGLFVSFFFFKSRALVWPNRKR